MASINLSGILRDPTGEFSNLNKIRFTHQTNTGQTLKGFRSVHEINDDGSYDIDLEYGNVFIESYDAQNRVWIDHGTLTINSDTPATDIPSLVGITTPATDADLLVIQTLVADAANSASEAETTKEETQAIKDETEALFDGFDSSVAESLAVVSGIDWDVEISFNDSAEMEKGYGTRNTYGNKAIDFSRASATGNVNKSGILETVAIDEPSITSEGLSVYGSYTNEVLYSEFDGGYPIGSSTIWGDTTITNSGIDFLDVIGSTVQFNDYTITSGENISASVYVYLDPNVTDENVYATFRVEARGGTTRAISVVIYIANGIVTTSTASTGWEMEYEFINSSVVRVSLLYIADTEGLGNDTCRIAVCPYYDASGANNTDYGHPYYGGFQMVGGVSTVIPYIATESTAVTRSSDVASIPLMGNMPAAGQPFSIVVDAYTTDAEVEQTVIRNERTILEGFFIRRNNTGYLEVGMSNGTTNLTATEPSKSDSGKYRLVFTYDGEDISLFKDGSLSATEAFTETPVYDLTSSLGIGQDGNFWQNGETGNLRIIHRALTANEVAALGAAE